MSYYDNSGQTQYGPPSGQYSRPTKPPRKGVHWLVVALLVALLLGVTAAWFASTPAARGSQPSPPPVVKTTTITAPPVTSVVTVPPETTTITAPPETTTITAPPETTTITKTVTETVKPSGTPQVATTPAAPAG